MKRAWLANARAFYKKRLTVREQALLFLFVAVVVFIWAGNLARRAGDWNLERRETRASLQEQNVWLNDAEAIAKRLSEAMKRVDPSKTYSATQLSGRVDRISREVGLRPDIDPVRTREGEIFNDHHLRVRMNRVALPKIVEFNERVRQEAPYISLERVALKADRRNRRQLDATFVISSFDLKEGAIQP